MNQYTIMQPGDYAKMWTVVARDEHSARMAVALHKDYHGSRPLIVNTKPVPEGTKPSLTYTVTQAL